MPSVSCQTVARCCSSGVVGGTAPARRPRRKRFGESRRGRLSSARQRQGVDEDHGRRHLVGREPFAGRAAEIGRQPRPGRRRRPTATPARAPRTPPAGPAASRSRSPSRPLRPPPGAWRRQLSISPSSRRIRGGSPGRRAAEVLELPVRQPPAAVAGEEIRGPSSPRRARTVRRRVPGGRGAAASLGPAMASSPGTVSGTAVGSVEHDQPGVGHGPADRDVPASLCGRRTAGRYVAGGGFHGRLGRTVEVPERHARQP